MAIEVDEFFKPLNLKSPPSLEDYKNAKLYIDVVGAFARTAHQCVYIIDYYKRVFFMFLRILCFSAGIGMTLSPREQISVGALFNKST